MPLRGAAPGGGIAFGIELDAIRARLPGGSHHVWTRVHEQADPHVQRPRLRNHRSQALRIRREVPAVVAGELAFAVRHESALVRPKLTDEVHQVVKRISLDVELCAAPFRHQRVQFRDVFRADVPAVGPWVNGDAMCAGIQADRRCACGTGDAQVTRVAHQRHLVQVHGQRGL
jgi:hypothetical protein